MPLIVPTLGPDGKPCPCYEGMDACSCGVAVTQDCRTRSGTATLCGFSEYTAPSVPPKKFLAQKFVGSYSRRNHADLSDCSSTSLVPGTCIVTVSGSNRYKPAGVSCGSPIIGATLSVDGGTGPTTVPITTIGQAQCAFACGSDPVYTVSRLSSSISFAVQPCAAGCDGDGGTVAEQLTDEDTEFSAIARAGQGKAWSAWSASACCTLRSQRGAGDFSFSWTEAEVRFTAKGAPGATANIEIVWQQQPVSGVGAIEQKTQILSISCDGSGEGEQIISVPAASGMMTCLTSWKVKS